MFGCDVRNDIGMNDGDGDGWPMVVLIGWWISLNNDGEDNDEDNKI